MSPIDATTTTNTKEEEILDVLVIGAGWAGLSTAKELHDQGVTRLKVLEGRHTYGGRCRTQVMADGVSMGEHGAQWIHGARKTNPVYRAALEAGVDLKRSAYESHTVYQDQRNGACRVVTDQYDVMYEALMEGKEGFYAYQEERQEEDDNDVSMEQCANDFLDKIDATQEQRIWMRALMDMELSQEYSAPLDQLSMFWWDSDEDIAGGDVEIGAVGYRGILEHFCRDIEHLLQFDSKVTLIDWTDKEKVVVHYKQNGQAQQLTGKRVVITVPLGVLQARAIDFQPALPKAKQTAIDRIGMGLLNKCLFLWDEQDVDQLPWPQDREWMERVVAPDSDEKQGLWTEHYYSKPVTGCPMLCAFTAGNVANKVEQWSDKEIQASAWAALKKQFAGHTIPPPKQVIVTKWGQDEWTFGSYSFNKLGGKHSDRKKLCQPIEQRLYFAGEACHSDHFGTTHGALLSGINVTKQIMKHDKSLVLKQAEKEVHSNATKVETSPAVPVEVV